MNVTSDRKTLVVFDPPRKGTRTEAEIEGVQWWLRKSQGGAEGGTSVLVFGIIRSQEKQQSKEVTWWSELTAAAAVEVSGWGCSGSSPVFFFFDCFDRNSWKSDVLGVDV